MARMRENSARTLGVGFRARLLGVGIRTKTLGLVAVPMIFLLLLSAVVVGRSVNDTRHAGQVVEFAGTSTEIAALVSALQLERSTTLAHLRAPSAPVAVTLLTQRKATDSKLIAVRGALTESPADAISPALGRAVAQAEAAHRGISSIRAGVDKSTSTPGDVQKGYAAILQADLALPDVLADAVRDSELARTLRAYGAVSQLIESATQERDAIGAGSASRRFTPDQYATLTGSIAAQTTALSALGSLTTTQDKQRLTALLTGPDAAEYLRYRKAAVAAGSTRVLAVPTAAFSAAATKRVTSLRAIQGTYATSVSDIAGSMRNSALTRSLLIAGLLALAVAFPIVHAIVLSRRLVRPLQRLTDSAEQIGAELPRMVERMHQPGDNPGIIIEPIEVVGRDEVGRLAEAFNTVNEMTVQVAVEQAALRGSIAEMFVNVARRNQALLGRQLSFLDQLEADEEDPDALRNLFHLDHLAAQMRRNAESLLVLAGIDATRRLRSPMPLSDVIRTAIGEIDGFQRVDLTLDADPDVTGLRALSVAHLLAELLDNATRFSDPHTRVRVSASFDGGNVVVDVYDQGLGLTADELANANHRLASPPATEIAVAQQLGFYVVGRIAQRLEIGVEIKSRESGGTVAVATLPATLFVDGSVPVTATRRNKPTKTPIEALAAIAAKPASGPAPASATAPTPVPVQTLLPLTDSRRRRHRGDVPKAPAPASAPAMPELEPVRRSELEMPLAVQDILPGRKLRRMGMATGQPATPKADASSAANAASATQIPQPRADAARPSPRPTPSPAARPASRLPVDTFNPPPATARPAIASEPSAGAPPAPQVPQLQPMYSPMRANEAARSALAELSQLSAAAYKPSSFSGGGKAASPSPELNQRTPKPVATLEAEPSTEPVTPAPPRSAEQVRGHLSGFRAGVERGRHAKAEPEPDERNEDQS